MFISNIMTIFEIYTESVVKNLKLFFIVSGIT